MDRYTGPVFTDKARKLKMAAVELKYMAGFKAVQPAHYPVPYHYQERLATHLIKLKKDGVITLPSPSTAYSTLPSQRIRPRRASV